MLQIKKSHHGHRRTADPSPIGNINNPDGPPRPAGLTQPTFALLRDLSPRRLTGSGGSRPVFLNPVSRKSQPIRRRSGALFFRRGLREPPAAGVWNHPPPAPNRGTAITAFPCNGLFFLPLLWNLVAMDNPSSPHCMNWGECALGVRRGGGGTIDCQRQEPENASHWIRVVFFSPVLLPISVRSDYTHWRFPQWTFWYQIMRIWAVRAFDLGGTPTYNINNWCFLIIVLWLHPCSYLIFP